MKVTHQFVVEWMSPTFEIDVRQVESSHGYNHLIVDAMSSNHLVIIQGLISYVFLNPFVTLD